MVQTAFRPKRPDETHQDILQPQRTLKQELLNKIKEEEQKATKLHYPFCSKAAKEALEEELSLYSNKIGKGQKAIAPEISEEWLSRFKQELLEKDTELFEYQGKETMKERIRVGTSIQSQEIGTDYKYKFKGTPWRVTVHVPLNE